jgi:hypothetical protein
MIEESGAGAGSVPLLTDPDLGGPKTNGSATLVFLVIIIIITINDLL